MDLNSEAAQAGVLYDKLYDQGYPGSREELAFYLWCRGYFAYKRRENAFCLLDLGCGRQHLKEEWQTCFPSIMYIGMDVSSKCRPQFTTSAHAIPFENRSVEIVYAHELLDHMSSEMCSAVISEIARVMKDRGYIGVGTAHSEQGRRKIVATKDWWTQNLSVYFKIDDVLEAGTKVGFLFRRK